MLEMGILDLAKMIRLALQNAASVASLMITTEAMVPELPMEEGSLAYYTYMGDMNSIWPTGC